MIPKIRELLKKYHVATLKELSEELKVSLDKIKNVSSGRTSLDSLFKIRSQYRVSLKPSAELAELIGIVLGDGNIFKFSRCQRLTISCNSSYKRYIKHVYRLIKKIFKKEPSVIQRSGPKCIDVCVHLQDIDLALGLPVGNKLKNKIKIPEWLFEKKEYLRRCLKGLFETDGHYGVSKKFYVEYIQLCSESKPLRKSTFRALRELGYSPQISDSYVRIAKKTQLHRFIKEMKFIRPFPSLAIK